MVVVIRAHLLDQPVVRAVESDIDTDDSEGLRAAPGGRALSVVSGAGLGRVVRAERGPAAPFHLLPLHAAVEDFGGLGFDEDLLLLVELYGFTGGHEADGDVALARGVVSEVDAEGPVAVVHDLPRDEQVQGHRLDVGVEVTPAEDFLHLGRRWGAVVRAVGGLPKDPPCLPGRSQQP